MPDDAAENVPAWAVSAGDVRAALSAAERAGRSPEAAVALAHVRAVAGDGEGAQRALAPALAADRQVPDWVRLQAWLIDARLAYQGGDDARGRRSLAPALRLAEREQLRLPIAAERSWLGTALRRDPALASGHRALLGPALGSALGHDQPGAPAAPVLVVEPLTEREREVLVHLAGMLNAAEVAEEMYLSVNTVKTHLKNIYRKLAATRRSEAVRRARQLELI